MQAIKPDPYQEAHTRKAIAARAKWYVGRYRPSSRAQIMKYFKKQGEFKGSIVRSVVDTLWAWGELPGVLI